MKLDKLLQSQGFGTRKHCQFLIKQGHVSLFDQICTDPNVNIEEQQLYQTSFSVFGQSYHYFDHVYLAVYKDIGYECSHQPHHHHSIFDLFPEHLNRRGIQSVGRLDQDTTGLLLLTDDGKWLQKLTHPRQHVAKVYRVTTQQPIELQELKKLEQGVQLHHEKGVFCATDIIQYTPYCFEMTIHQGVYHQVKRMLASIGHKVVQLHRVQIGHLNLTMLNLDLNQWCYLTKDQQQLAQQG